jgi:hypothetical protein
VPHPATRRVQVAPNQEAAQSAQGLSLGAPSPALRELAARLNAPTPPPRPQREYELHFTRPSPGSGPFPTAVYTRTPAPCTGGGGVGGGGSRARQEGAVEEDGVQAALKALEGAEGPGAEAEVVAGDEQQVAEGPEAPEVAGGLGEVLKAEGAQEAQEEDEASASLIDLLPPE